MAELLLFMNSYHSKSATHLLGTGRLLLLALKKCHPPFGILLACGSHQSPDGGVLSFEKCHPPFGILLACGSHHRQMVECYHSKSATHLLGFCSLAVATIAR
jgi:hypothetical protein